MSTRIITDESTGKHVDEYLEVIFKQIFEWDVAGAQGPAIEQLLEEYTSRIFDKSAVSCQGIITDPEAAALWASQFGELRLSNVSTKLLNALRNENEAFHVEINYSAKIGPDRDGQKRVYGRSVHQVTLLAGVQVLRETANQILNKLETEQHH